MAFNLKPSGIELEKYISWTVAEIGVNRPHRTVEWLMTDASNTRVSVGDGKYILFATGVDASVVEDYRNHIKSQQKAVKSAKKPKQDTSIENEA